MSTAPQTPQQELKRRTRRGFLTLGAGAVAGYAGWHSLRASMDGDQLPPRFRQILEFNEGVARRITPPRALARTFARSAAATPRPNGDEGLAGPLDLASYRVRLEGLTSGPRDLSLQELRALPAVEMTTELMCVEGWSQVVNWTGIRVADLARSFGAKRTEYVSMATPDKGYYVGLDSESALHPQSLLAYQMNGAPLDAAHGAPLRLVIPVKYGIKNIKRVGSIRFMDERPADYWAEQGYDWYAGL